MFDWTYLISCLILYFLAGIFLYYGDVAYGKNIYQFYFNWIKRPYYNLTHSGRLERLPPGSETGFLHHRKASVKAGFFGVISVIQSAIMLVSADVNVVWELIAMVAEVPVGFLGMMIAPSLMPIWRRKDKIFGALDEIEEKGFGEAMKEPIGKVKHVFTDIGEKISEAVSGDDEAPAPQQAPKEKTPELDPDELINSYTGRR